MIPKSCKRLAEVDFPIAEVSQHAAREKSIRHGHPSTLHPWWARRPLASSRAVLMALLLPDPCDAHCPATFKDEARRILLGMDRRPRGWADAIEPDEGLRRILLKFISDFANWDLAATPAYLKASRALVKAAHGGESPLVMDPFAGGGSIPLEALRVGCEAFASDLNPVACLILKVMLEDIPRHGSKLADELRHEGRGIKKTAAEELVGLYPKDPDGATPIAYLWARTVRCEAPNCGAEIPLMRSFWLCRKPNQKTALKCRIHRPPDMPPQVELDIFEPEGDWEVEAGTMVRGKATCLCCNAVLSPHEVRAQIIVQHGGSDPLFHEHRGRIGGARLVAVVTLGTGQAQRHYRVPTGADYEAVHRSWRFLAAYMEEWKRVGQPTPSLVPDEQLSNAGKVGFGVGRYGMERWSDLFTMRQKAALTCFARLVRNSAGDASRECMALIVDRCAKQLNHMAAWNSRREIVEGALSRYTLSLSWNFAEINPLSCFTGSFSYELNQFARTIQVYPMLNVGRVRPADAANHSLPDDSVDIWFTDPPYYDAIPYSDLSDFFLVWLKRMLPDHPLFRNTLRSADIQPYKSLEIVQDEERRDDRQGKDRHFFEQAMTKAFTEGRRLLRENGVGTVVFAHRTTAGWDALFSGLVDGGMVITGSWPINTAAASSHLLGDPVARATDIHLICRPRPEAASIGCWVDIQHELSTKITQWMKCLHGSGLRGADLAFSCIGPALEIFSRHRAVQMADSRQVTLPKFLDGVWAAVGWTALEQILDPSGTQGRDKLQDIFGENSLLVILFLWNLQLTRIPNCDDNRQMIEEAAVLAAAKGFKLPTEFVQRFTKAMGIKLDCHRGRIIDEDRSTFRLLPVAERAPALFGAGGASATIAAWIQDGVSRNTHSVLDRVHAGMLLQAEGYNDLLVDCIRIERESGTRFLQLATALAALYPAASAEKRLLDAMPIASEI